MINEQLSVAGVNFRKTSLEIRNKFAVTPEQARQIYNTEGAHKPGSFFILSTCNRTEIYSTGIAAKTIVDLLSRHSGLSETEICGYAFFKSGHDAVQHLLRVASGLDSQILGDYEIVGQLKKAFALARACNTANGYLEKLVNVALQASKEVKNKTGISDGTTSVSYAVIQLLKQNAGNGIINICLAGLGKIGMLTLKNLRYYLPASKIILLNRNELKAELASLNQHVQHAPFKQLKEVIKTSDILIVATGAEQAIVCKKDIEHSSVKIVFDLAVPSNVHADVRTIPGLQLYNIDQLSQIVNQSVIARKNEVPVAEAIINAHLLDFKQWENRRNLYCNKLTIPVPVI